MSRDEAILAGKLATAADRLAAYRDAIETKDEDDTIGVDFGCGPVDADGNTKTMGLSDALFPRDFALDLIFVMQMRIDHELTRLGVSEAQ